MQDLEGTCTAEGSNKLCCSNGDATKGLFDALEKAAAAAPLGSYLIVLNTVEYFINHLRNWNELRARGFLKPRNNKPYADAVTMRRVDSILRERGISITGRPPIGDEVHHLAFVQGSASEIASSVATDPSSWGI